MYKPLPQGSAAVLVMNHGTLPIASTSVNLSAVPGLACAPGPCKVRDLWAHADLGLFTGVIPVTGIASHDVAYFTISS
jgi:hypothetical protein